MENFWNFEGNDFVKKRLEKMLATGRVPHLLLFSGPEASLLYHFAYAFAKRWLGNTASSFDIHVLSPEGKTGMVGIQSIRQILDTLQKAPYQAAGKVAIFEEAERMLPTSANALLKVLEEPPSQTLVILCSAHPERLLPTIVSRCQRVVFDQTPVTLTYDDLSKAMLALLCNDRWDFPTINAGCRSIVASIQERRKAKEEDLKEEMKVAAKEMNTASKELMEQEIEGVLALEESYARDAILQTVLMFYRDLHALGSFFEGRLLLESHRKALVQAYNQGKTVSLDEVLHRVAFAKKASERGGGLQTVLEQLFL